MELETFQYGSHVCELCDSPFTCMGPIQAPIRDTAHCTDQCMCMQKDFSHTHELPAMFCSKLCYAEYMTIGKMFALF